MLKSKEECEKHQKFVNYKGKKICVDNDFIEPLKKIWDMGYETTNSCSGTYDFHGIKNKNNIWLNSYISVSMGNINENNVRIKDKDLMKFRPYDDWHLILDSKDGIINMVVSPRRKNEKNRLKKYLIRNNIEFNEDKKGFIIKDYFNNQKIDVEKIKCLKDIVDNVGFYSDINIFPKNTIDLMISLNELKIRNMTDKQVLDKWDDLIKELGKAQCI